MTHVVSRKQEILDGRHAVEDSVRRDCLQPVIPEVQGQQSPLVLEGVVRKYCDAVVPQVQVLQHTKLVEAASDQGRDLVVLQEESQQAAHLEEVKGQD